MNSSQKGLNLQLIEKHLKMYNKISDLTCFAIDDAGNIIHSEGESVQYCSKFIKITGERCPCSQAHLYASKQAEKIGESYIFYCPAGLVHWTAPLVFKGVFRGAFIAGPVQMSLADEYMVDSIIKQYNIDIKNRGLLQAYLKLVPVMDPESVRYHADMLYLLAKDIMQEESLLLDKRKEKYKEQSVLNEEIQMIKNTGQDLHILDRYPVELEKELMDRVKRGDKIGAKTILNELLGYVLFQHGSNLENTKARVLELMVMLSRAAVEGGAKLEMIFGLNFKYIQEISKLNSVDDLCQWIVTVLEHFTDSVFSINNSANLNVVQKAVAFINKRFMDNISLEKVADHVYLSPAYFSRLFKKEVGMNFSEYLNKVRVEESKKYLVDLKFSLSDIANIVGFSDQSYYTKVFKKIEDVSPGQYRKMNI